MNRNVRRLRDQVSDAVEDRARKVFSLLDVDRIRRAPERRPHLLGHRRELVLHHFQTERINLHLYNLWEWI